MTKPKVIWEGYLTGYGSRKFRITTREFNKTKEFSVYEISSDIFDNEYWEPVSDLIEKEVVSEFLATLPGVKSS